MVKSRHLLMILILCMTASASFAKLEVNNVNSVNSIQSDLYRIGKTWGKKLVEKAELDNLSSLKKIVTATVAIGGATGFYLGEFQNAHVVATNFHVCPKEFLCVEKDVRFSLLDKRIRIKKLLGAWPEIDLALLVIDVPKALRPIIKSAAAPFDFNGDLYQGQKLITAGFGLANNPLFKLMVNMDDDCKVFSANSDYRLMEDPDLISKSSYKAWSFANGCDVSHGDSGSALVDRETGSVVGIMWTGKVPKSYKIQIPDFLANMFHENSELIWQELSYAVPAPKIYEVLTNKINNNEIQEKRTQKVLLDLLNGV